MAFKLLSRLGRCSAAVLLVALAAPVLSEPVGRGVNVTVYSSPT